MRASARLCVWQCCVRLCGFVCASRAFSARNRPQRAAQSTVSAYPSAPPDVPIVRKSVRIGAAASFARRVMCRRAITAGLWLSTLAPVTSASSVRPSRTSRCVRTVEYPLEYPRTAAPVRRLRTADAPRSAARRRLQVPAVPCRRDRLGAQYSRRSGVSPANSWAGAAASFARRVVCRPMAAGSWVSTAAAPATSASSARPSQT